MEVVGGGSCSFPLPSLSLDSVGDVSDWVGFSEDGLGCVAGCSVIITVLVGVSVFDISGGNGVDACVPKVNVNVELSLKVVLYCVKFVVSFHLKVMESLSFNTSRHVASIAHSMSFYLNSNFGFASYPSATSMTILTSRCKDIGNVWKRRKKHLTFDSVANRSFLGNVSKVQGVLGENISTAVGQKCWLCAIRVLFHTTRNTYMWKNIFTKGICWF